MGRTWHEVSDKISKRDMDKIDVSKDKEGGINVEEYQKQYLGGDNDEFEGFYNSDDEIEFENFKKNKKANK